jgi:hypothetical protein
MQVREDDDDAGLLMDDVVMVDGFPVSNFFAKLPRNDTGIYRLTKIISAGKFRKSFQMSSRFFCSRSTFWSGTIFASTHYYFTYYPEESSLQ